MGVYLNSMRHRALISQEGRRNQYFFLFLYLVLLKVHSGDSTRGSGIVETGHMARKNACEVLTNVFK